MVALKFDHADRAADQPSREWHSEMMGPSSMLRESVHSPLRVSTGKV